jgi:hypothetical protein
LLVACNGNGGIVTAKHKRAFQDAILAILDGYSKGTRFGIRMDDDGLLFGLAVTVETRGGGAFYLDGADELYNCKRKARCGLANAFSVASQLIFRHHAGGEYFNTH